MHTLDELAQIEAIMKAGRTSEQILRNVDETLRTAGEGVEMLAVERYDFNGPITFTGMSPEDEIPSAPDQPTREMIAAMAYPLVQSHRRGLRIAITFGVATTHALQNLRSTEPDFDAWWAPRSEELRADELCRYFYQLRSVLLKEGYLRPTTAVQEYVSRKEENWIGVVTNLHVAPNTHRGADVTGLSALELVEAYLGHLGGIVSEAWGKFCPEADSTARMRPVVPGAMTVTREET
jgi:hypothetical protein